MLIPEYTFHPVANLFPMIEGEDWDSLVADIKAHGLHEPIWLFEGRIIDGRNRYQACKAAGVAPRFREWEGEGSLTDFVLSLNLHRRHLSASQLAMVGARAKERYADEALERRNANLKQNGSANSEESTDSANGRYREIGKSSTLAAQTIGISSRSIERATEVIEKGAPELVQAVEEDRISVRAAVELTSLPAEEQRRIVSQPKPQLRESLRVIHEEQEQKKLSRKQLHEAQDRAMEEGTVREEPTGPASIRELRIRRIAYHCGENVGRSFRSPGAGLTDREIGVIARIQNVEVMREVVRLRLAGWSTRKAVAHVTGPKGDVVFLTSTVTDLVRMLREHGPVYFEGEDREAGWYVLELYPMEDSDPTIEEIEKSDRIAVSEEAADAHA